MKSTLFILLVLSVLSMVSCRGGHGGGGHGGGGHSGGGSHGGGGHSGGGHSGRSGRSGRSSHYYPIYIPRHHHYVSGSTCYAYSTPCTTSNSTNSLQFYVKSDSMVGIDATYNLYSTDSCSHTAISSIALYKTECVHLNATNSNNILHCSSSRQSLWLKVLDEHLLTTSFANCSGLFGEEYINISNKTCFMNGTDAFKPYKKMFEESREEMFTFTDGWKLVSETYTEHGKCVSHSEIEGGWNIGNMITLSFWVIIILSAFCCLCRKNNTSDNQDNGLNDDDENPNTSLLSSVEEHSYTIFSPSGPQHVVVTSDSSANPTTMQQSVNGSNYPVNQYPAMEAPFSPSQPSFLPVTTTTTTTTTPMFPNEQYYSQQPSFLPATYSNRSQ